VRCNSSSSGCQGGAYESDALGVTRDGCDLEDTWQSGEHTTHCQTSAARNTDEATDVASEVTSGYKQVTSRHTYPICNHQHQLVLAGAGCL
jgi:hypothetical protein